MKSKLDTPFRTRPPHSASADLCTPQKVRTTLYVNTAPPIRQCRLKVRCSQSFFSSLLLRSQSPPSCHEPSHQFQSSTSLSYSNGITAVTSEWAPSNPATHHNAQLGRKSHSLHGSSFRTSLAAHRRFSQFLPCVHNTHFPRISEGTGTRCCSQRYPEL